MIQTLFIRLKFTAVRILPPFGTVGQPLTYRLIIQNISVSLQKSLVLMEDINKPGPDFETFLHTPEPGENQRNWFDRKLGFYRWQWLMHQNQVAKIPDQLILAVAPDSQKEVRVEIIPLRRGILQFNSLTLAHTDSFGLFRSLRTISLSQSMPIIPKRYNIPQFCLPGGRRYHSGGVVLTGSVGDSEEFVSLRDYRPGDPLRRIHWKSWAKTGKPVVKEFQEEFYVRHALILDTFQDVEYSEIFEEAVCVAASFACTAQSQESLLDLMFVGTDAYCFTVGRGLGETQRILEVLASVRPCRDKSFKMLSAQVMEQAALLSGCICIFLEWDKARQDFCRRLNQQGIPCLIMVVTPESPKNFPSDMMVYWLEVGKIEQSLTKLSANF